MKRLKIKEWVFCTGVLLVLCFLCRGKAVFAERIEGFSRKTIQRLNLRQLIKRIQDPNLKAKDRQLLGAELEDRMATTPDELESLISLIGKEKGQIRQEAINAVSNTVDPALSPVFIQGLTDENPIINAVSAGMCGKLRVRKAADGLVKLINRLGPVSGVVKSDKDRAVIAAVFALGEIQDESKIPFLVSLFGKMRGYEVMALIKYGKKVVPAMFREIVTTDQGFIRDQAERVLLSIRDPEAIPLFEKEMENPESPSRNISIRVLLNVNAKKTLPRLLQLWEKEGDKGIASLMLDHLIHYQIKDALYGPFAQKILGTSHNRDLRKKASSVLGKTGGKGAKEALEDALDDKDPLVKAFAARALKSLELQSNLQSQK